VTDGLDNGKTSDETLRVRSAVNDIYVVSSECEIKTVRSHEY
jgi:hypothetical protein